MAHSGQEGADKRQKIQAAYEALVAAVHNCREEETERKEKKDSRPAGSSRQGKDATEAEPSNGKGNKE
eukprot:3965787-Heterocapsa_arctica.AAC.1